MDELRRAGDSCGARIELRATGVPPGLGAPLFDKLDADIAFAMMGINAVKGVQIGDGFGVVPQRGSVHGDNLTPAGFASNHAGGVLGGHQHRGRTWWWRSRSSPPARSRCPRASIDRAGCPTVVQTFGRHDPVWASAAHANRRGHARAGADGPCLAAPGPMRRCRVAAGADRRGRRPLDARLNAAARPQGFGAGRQAAVLRAHGQPVARNRKHGKHHQMHRALQHRGPASGQRVHHRQAAGSAPAASSPWAPAPGLAAAEHDRGQRHRGDRSGRWWPAPTPVARFRLVCHRFVQRGAHRGKWSRATTHIRSAIAMPATACGRPRAGGPRLMLGAAAWPGPTTATSDSSSKPPLTKATPSAGRCAWASSASASVDQEVVSVPHGLHKTKKRRTTPATPPGKTELQRPTAWARGPTR